MLKTSFVAFQRRKAAASPDTNPAAYTDDSSGHVVRTGTSCIATAAMATTSVLHDNRNAIATAARVPAEVCCDKTKVAKAVSFNLKSGDCIDGVCNRGNGLRKTGGRQKRKQPSAGGCFGCVSKQGNLQFIF